VLRKRGQIDDVGGPAYVSGLTEGVPRSMNAVHYARIVFDHAVRRQAIKIGAKLIEDAGNHELTTTEVISLADKAIVDLAKTRTSDQLVDVRAAIPEIMADLERRQHLKGAVTGVPTGFETLDGLTGGLQRGDLVVVGARPSMGKTALALNIITASAGTGTKVLAFSLEMRRTQLEHRMLAQLADVPLTRILGGYTNDDDNERIGGALGKLGQMSIHIDDRASQTIHDIRSTARQVKSENGLDLVVIDYAQLIQGSLERRGANRREELDDISRRAKLLADDLSVPIILLSQLRRVDGRKPRMEDLKESGSLEQDADLVLLLHRRHHRVSGKTLLMLEKQRNGPTGAVQLTFERDTQRFTDGGEELTSDDATEPAKPAAPKAYGRKRSVRSEVDD
jgi:replicative DNA helicase